MARVRTRFAGQTLGGRVLYTICRSGVCWTTQLYTRMTIEGKQHLPETGGYILAPVHRSYMDTPITACVTLRRVRFMGKDTMWKYSLFGKLLTALGAFPVSRGTADREALTRCIAVLEGGEPLVLFPEGERKDGPLVQPLFDGAAFIAAKAGVPIVPVGIGGSARVMPRGAKFIFPRKVHVVVGEPIHAERNAAGRVPRPAMTAMTERLHADLQRLYDHAQSVVG
ncbi:MAG: 1-acyl-sn-glycerol-3-phosphate acyltransferase [Ilumatobacter sp.]|nr:1-acyl-sn-glycerol-3-phosphate acyltransferase [Ilumatobacter sp.]